MKLLLFLLFGVYPGILFAQQLIIQPLHPSWKDSVSIDYADSSGMYKHEPHIYARVEMANQDGTVTNMTLLLSRHTGGVFQGRLGISKQAAAVKIEVYSLDREAENGSAVIRLYDPLTGKLVPGAVMAFAFFGVKPLFEEETKRYPKHFLPYGKYFNILSFQMNDESKPLIKEYLKKLEKLPEFSGNRPADLLAALCVGYAKTDQLSLAKHCMMDLVNKYPQSGYTAFAFIFYDYESYKAGTWGGDGDLRAKIKNVLISYPGYAISQDRNVIYHLQNDSTISLEQFKAAMLPVLNAEPMNYWSLSLMTSIFIARKEQLDEARSILLKALVEFQQGGANHAYRVSAARYRSAISGIYGQLAEIALLQHRYPDAALYTSAALNNNDETMLNEKLLQIRAEAYQKSGNIAMAMDDYTRLYIKGQPASVDSMKKLFPRYNNDIKDFTAFLAGLDAGGKATNAENPVAAQFSGKDMQGNAVRLKDLQGKVVVLNFWGTGCGPCIREMPELNKLVKRYTNNQDVVFLAITADATEVLNRFFEKRAFDYTVVNDCGEAWKAYAIVTQPTHVVIGRKGEIVARINGALDDISEILGRWVDKSL